MNNIELEYIGTTLVVIRVAFEPEQSVEGLDDNLSSGELFLLERN